MKKFQLLLVLLLLLELSVTFASENKKPRNAVANHDSPYLAMHGTDPVNWLPWGKDILEKAQKEDKLIFMSVGYFSCYWCHVMQNESFINEDVAKILNKYFIPVIVDRELNPALDAHLVSFMEKYRGAAGWPMNIFLTPEGYPLIGSLYAPQKQLQELLVKIVARWQSDSDKLKDIAKQVFKPREHKLTSNPYNNHNLTKKFEAGFIQQTLQAADSMAGGFGEQSKFPMTSQLLSLINIYNKNNNQEIREFLTLTLDQMATQGLRDHLDGGFFRYTVDPTWKIPHFEKMLYDNALLANIYLQAGIVFKNERYKDVARDTLQFLLKRFTSTNGGMYSSFSAVDDKGIEGAYYTWTNEDLKNLLTPDEHKVISFAWNLFGEYPIEEGYIPVSTYTEQEIAAYLKMDEVSSTQLLNQARSKLSQARNQRHLPIDTKQLASWNGLALTAFSQAGNILGDDKFKQAAQQLQNYITTKLWDKKTLRRAISQSEIMSTGKLEDYAFVTEGLYEYALLTNKQADFDVAHKVAQAGWQRFFNTSGWHQTDDLILPIETSEILFEDGALPSTSATLIRISLALAQTQKDGQLKKLALGALNNGHDLIDATPFYYAQTISILAALNTQQP